MTMSTNSASATAKSNWANSVQAKTPVDQLYARLTWGNHDLLLHRANAQKFQVILRNTTLYTSLVENRCTCNVPIITRIRPTMIMNGCKRNSCIMFVLRQLSYFASPPEGPGRAPCFLPALPGVVSSVSEALQSLAALAAGSVSPK